MLRNTVLCLFFASGLAKEHSTEIPHLKHVLHSLSAQEWDTDELTCRNKIINMLESVKNSTLWATWVWDSIPQGTTGTFYGANMHLGNYDQCLRPPWLATSPELRQQYCLADIEMSKSKNKTLEIPGPYYKAEDYYLNVGTHFGRSFSYMAYGVCLPAGCPTRSAEKFVRALLNTSYLLAAKDAQVTIHHCDDGSRLVQSWGYYICVLLGAALVLTAAVSTYYVKEYPVSANTNTLVNHVAKSFCLRRNYGAVFKINKDELTSLHSVKFLMSYVTVHMHYIYNLQFTSISNALDATVPATLPGGLFMAHGDLCIEFFFSITGLLLGRSLRTLDLTTKINVFKFILKRYIRLIGPFVVSVLYLINILIYEGNGPIYAKITKVEQQACQKNWWLSFLMVGNIFDITEMCYIVTWYIAADFHFYIITLSLLYVYRKRPTAGKVATGVVLAVAILGPAWSTYVYDLPAVGFFKITEPANIRHCKYFRYGHIRTYNRMAPYAAGLFVGYVMSFYMPPKHQEVWSKTTSLLGACGSFFVSLAVLATGALCFRYGVHGLLACVFVVFNRLFFSIGALGILVFIIYGDLPVIKNFFNWSGFVPLSRLSYGIYVIHYIFLWETKMTQRNHFTYTRFGSIIDTVGITVMSLGWSLVMWLVVEAPLINFASRYLTTKSVSKKMDEAPINKDARNGGVLDSDQHE